MSLKQKLQELIPPAYYSNGAESKCLVYNICNMFDIDPQSYMEVKEKKSMEIKSREQALQDYDLGALIRLRKEEAV